MSGATAIEVPAVLPAYDFSRFARVVVVGGRGLLLVGLLKRYPQMSGIVCCAGPADPAIRARIEAAPDWPEVADRCRIADGDAFAFGSIPPGADLYLIKRVLHEWDDPEAVRLLTNVRAAIPDTGTLLVLDAVLKAPNESDLAQWLDLNMLALLSGRERTEDELAGLLSEAGFRLARTVPAGALSILEAVPF
jgi:hypothetical protein